MTDSGSSVMRVGVHAHAPLAGLHAHKQRAIYWSCRPAGGDKGIYTIHQKE
jgi:hypothetical protein